MFSSKGGVHPVMTGLNLYPYIRLGPRRRCASEDLKLSFAAGAGLIPTNLYSRLNCENRAAHLRE